MDLLEALVLLEQQAQVVLVVQVALLGRVDLPALALRGRLDPQDQLVLLGLQEPALLVQLDQVDLLVPQAQVGLVAQQVLVGLLVLAVLLALVALPAQV